ncbi:MAG: methyltransferase domain-containing protein [Bacilli bacterium]|nr:methyltransferase domain-containing protein [Bacilli bacterium]
MKEEIRRWDILGKYYWRDRTPEQRWLHDYLLYPFLFDFIKKANCKTVLDFGCSDGGLVNFCIKNGLSSSIRLFAFDKSKEMISLCKKNIDSGAVVTNNLRNLKFDLVIANMVIQDVYNLEELLLFVKKHMSENGALVVTLPHPNHSSEISDKPTARHEIIGVDENNTIKEKMYWSDNRECWTYKYHRSLDVYKNIFDKSGYLIEKIIYPKPVKNGECDSVLYEYNLLNETTMAIVLKEK